MHCSAKFSRRIFVASSEFEEKRFSLNSEDHSLKTIQDSSVEDLQTRWPMLTLSKIRKLKTKLIHRSFSFHSSRFVNNLLKCSPSESSSKWSPSALRLRDYRVHSVATSQLTGPSTISALLVDRPEDGERLFKLNSADVSDDGHYS